MITDYASLKTSIAGFLHRSDLTTMIPEFIADGERRIYDDLRVKQMETAFTATMVAGEATVPDDLLEWQWLYIDATPLRKLARRDLEWIITHYRGEVGPPSYFARNSDKLIFGPSPDAQYNLLGSYYKRLAALSDSNTSNWLITDAPELIRYAALCEAAPYLQDDERIAIWEGKYQTAKNRIERTEKREQFSGSKLSTKAG